MITEQDWAEALAHAQQVRGLYSGITTLYTSHLMYLNQLIIAYYQGIRTKELYEALRTA